MANKITLDFIIDDKGTLTATAAGATKAKKGLDGVGKSASTADRNLKGASKQSSNSTKNFSKMAQGMTGLVPIYAVLAANVFAVTAAFQFFKKSADLRVLQESQANYAAQTGRSLSLLTSRIQEATDGILTFQEAASSISIGNAAGLTADQLTGLADIAKRASLALGRDLPDSFDRLIRGATKAEPELLDELGIILRLEAATERYAQTLNKNRKDLTAYQRTQAVVNEILRQGEEKFEDLGGQVNKFNKLGKSFNDLLKDIMKHITPIAEFIAGSLSENVIALTGAFALLGSTVAKGIIPAAPAMQKLADASEEAQKRMAKVAGTGKTAEAIKSLEPLTTSQLKLIEKSTKAAGSKIIQYSKTTKDAVIRDLRIMKAERAALDAESTSGMQRWAATWKAELYSLQATHGRVMGSMRAATLAFTRFANKLMGAAGLIGIVVVLIGLVKSLLDSLKDPALLDFANKVETLNDNIVEQNKAISDIVISWKEAKTAAEKFGREANLISNISYDNLIGFRLLDSEAIVRTTAAGSRGGSKRKFLDIGVNNQYNEKVVEDTLPGISNKLAAEAAYLTELGHNADELLGINLVLIESMEEFKEAISLGGAPEDISAAIKKINRLLAEIPDASKASRIALKEEQAALQSLVGSADAYSIALRNMRQQTSEFDGLLNVFRDMEDSLKGLPNNIKKVGDLKPEQSKGLFDVFGLDLEDTTSIEVAISKLRAIINKTLLDEENTRLRSLATQKSKVEVMRKATPYMREQLSLEYRVKELSDEIYKNETLLARALKLNGDKENTKTKEFRQQLDILNAQLITAKRLTGEASQLADNIKASFESSFSKGLSDLIKNDESSLKDAIADMSETVLRSAADTISKQLTRKLTFTLFGEKDAAGKMFDAMTKGAMIVEEAIVRGFNTATGAITDATSTAKDKITGAVNKDAPWKEGGSFLDWIYKGSKPDNGNGATTTNAQGDVIVTAKRSTGIFAPFVESMKTLFSPEGESAGFVKNLGEVFKTGATSFGSLFKGLFQGFLSLFGSGGGSGAIASLASLASAAFATGGIAKGSEKGHLATLHGTEAVVPLPNNRAIPVDLKGAGQQQNNVTVNVAMDSNGQAETQTEGTGANLGAAIASAVQKELQNQKRSGGILNPYGAA